MVLLIQSLQQLNIFSSYTRVLTGKLLMFHHFMLQTLINMAYCCLILLGKSIQKIVFGELRISEQQVGEIMRASLTSHFNRFPSSTVAHERQVLEFYFLQIHLRFWHRKRPIPARDRPMGFMVLGPWLSSSDVTTVQGSL